MKTKILPIVISLLLFGGIVLAESPELPDPGLTPDSPFYFLERIAEEIGNFFTFGDLKKAERYTTLAAERLAEAKAVAEKGKSELVEKTLERYEMQLQNSIIRAKKAQNKGENAEEVMTRVGLATQKHLEVLAEVYEKVPEQAKPAIENAMEVSLKGHEKAVETLKEQNALGDVSEEVSLPENVPQEVRETIQTRVQQKLAVEKALEGVDTSKSLREICQEKGGTPEMCEQFPLDKFESFKQIEDYCTGLGGQPEVCSTLEDKCKEFGVTTPNECFILLMVSSVSAYQSAEMKVVPAQPLSEEEMQQQEESLKQRYIPGVSKVIIYTSPNCPHCVEAKSWFQQHGIPCEEIDIFLSENAVKRDELMHKVGDLVVPIVEVEDEIIIGFIEESYSEFFGME